MILRGVAKNKSSTADVNGHGLKQITADITDMV
jgi:hypothetical protein